MLRYDVQKNLSFFIVASSLHRCHKHVIGNGTGVGGRKEEGKEEGGRMKEGERESERREEDEGGFWKFRP